MNVELKRTRFDRQSHPDGAKRPRLAIVSTYDDLCGIAGYTRHLVRQLDDAFEVEVFDLDQFFMKAIHPKVRRHADRQIRDICKRLLEFDAVNIQLEHGIFGRRDVDILRRLGWLLEAAPSLSVTFHTVFPTTGFDYRDFFRNLGRLKLQEALSGLGRHRKARALGSGFLRRLRALSKRKPLSVIVHTRREMRTMRYVHELENVFDHPLAFMTPAEARNIRESATRDSFPLPFARTPHTRIVGVFGFLGEYKGFEIAIRALHLLPDNYHLVIFGALHPHSIAPGEAIHPLIRSLFSEAYVGRSVIDDVSQAKVSMSLDASAASMLISHPKDIHKRIHFAGAQSDESFARGMAICDCVVLPYLEVGQSSSGPVSLALEMGARIIASRNHAFLQFARYHPDALEFFDIGNHVELAERILAEPTLSAAERQPRYNADTNRDVYIRANGSRTGDAARKLNSSSREIA